ncbi:HECT domain protein [Cordyceps militaris CM01]|uniref:HECT-type E3 ubiquitin transferase n=1 Tax=Cordyceps militaris (strain CM01) TaxID=983644 RepID=G3JCH4_CORMM|nr:HECT domain protein [Cordyceps militaris CM01]EGX94635.1 HECT domain protein [Cordyceps militaris CM01]
MSAQALRLPQRRPSDSNGHHDGPDDGNDRYDVFDSLWQEALFARLPPDAPPQLTPFVREIENPRRVYAIHRASRRHDFQLLVQLLIHQLRDGCGSDTCHTSTCFSCRKRLAGKAPIRRYNPTSARTLAIYLASQDNPERGICPSLRRPKDVTPAVNNLVFSKCSVPKSASQNPSDGDAQRTVRRTASKSQSKSRSPSESEDAQVQGKETIDTTLQPESLRDSTEICISERPVARDYRSFAATTFGTIAFKMIEWLTPSSLDALSRKICDIRSSSPSNPKPTPVPSPDPQPITGKEARDRDHDDTRDASSSPHKSSPHIDPHSIAESRSKRDQPAPKRNSKPALRSKPTVETTRRKSIEPVCVTAEADNATLHRPTRMNGYHPDKLSRRTKSPTTITFKPAFFENVPIPPAVADEVTVTSSDGEESTKEEMTEPPRPGGNHEHRQKQHSAEEVHDEDLDHATAMEYPLPQTLSQLNIQIIDFICDVYVDDHTSEDQLHGNIDVGHNYPEPQERQGHLVRTPQPRDAACKKLWKDFHEQTLFSVLSDPAALILSFSKDGILYDSHSLWYCMVRLMRASPSLVLHSLWLSAASLFSLPEANVRKEKGKSRCLSPHQVESVMSICLHALVALVPVVPDSRLLYDLSRIRSHGLALSNPSASYRRPSGLCLKYDDAFSNSLALRLARRLFLAITIRQKHGNAPLSSLLEQLDLRNTSLERMLKFTQEERLLHETRVPTLLLDWARAVLLHEWDGKAQFYKDGTFHGALSFMDTLYKNRNVLLLGEMQFRVEYFSERLDAMRVPVQWTTTNSTDHVGNILDYPYLFQSETLVTYFRSINFACMSRTFEEASSLKRRMSAIVDPGSLITNPHHKVVLKDMLRTAASKYLVLDIGRTTVLRDAFDQLWRRQKRELLRPLKIHLGEDAGEEGFDSGGVQQEFFRLAVAQCLDPVYGAFTVDERNHMAWFKPQPAVEDWKFELMGLLLSLAVYNGLTLPVNFPKAFYRKLLKQPVDQLYHIADGWPELTNGLTKLLEWDEKDGLIEDIFARTYEFSVPGVGKDVTIHMLEDKHKEQPGSPVSADTDVPEAPYVTNENRDEYVNDYIRYLTDYSVRRQFDSFRRGFVACLPEQSLTLLTPSILQSVVEGVQEIDISELRRYARYVGWDTSHHTVRDFWSIVKRYDDRMKRKLLEFVTASDRVPVSGLKNVQFVIQKNGEENEGGHLPTAYTCYGTLLLPEYRDKEVLRERLGMALENAQGFGFA